MASGMGSVAGDNNTVIARDDADLKTGGSGDIGDLLPNPYDINDPAVVTRVNELMDKFLKVGGTTRTSFEWGWFRNLCLSGDTTVALLDGTNIPIQELAQSIGKGRGKSVWVYGIDTRTGFIVPAEMTDVWSNGQKEVIRLTLDDGETFSCTKDHPILTWFRGYVQAGDLREGESLVPLYRGYSRGYECLYQPCMCIWEKTHRRVAEEIYGKIPKGMHVHHINSVKYDNRPENLQILTAGDHQRITNEINKAAMVAGVKQSWIDPAMRTQRIEAIRENFRKGVYKDAAKKRWSNLEMRERHRAGVKRNWEERKAKIAQDKDIPMDQVRATKAHGLCAIHINHKIAKIESVGIREVFDATVPRTNNFALGAGVFVHNCMIAGAQDIIRFRGVVKLRQTGFLPTVFTNKMRSKFKDLLGALQGRVPIKHLPATDDDSAHATAEIGERVRSVIYAEAQLDQKENDVNGWFICTGNVFGVPYYDYDEKYGTVEQPKLECASCGGTYGVEDVKALGIDTDAPECPTCGEDVGKPGPDGQPLMPQPLTPSATETELLPIGALCVDWCSPFEIRGDIRVVSCRDWKWFVRVRRYDVDFAREKFGYEGDKEDSGGGIDDGNQTISQHYLDVIAALNDQFNPQGAGWVNSAAGQTRIPKVTAYELYMLPTEQFPEGLCAVRIGNLKMNLKEIGPLDSEYGAGVRKGQKFLPIVHGKATSLPGRLWGSSPLDDAVPLQQMRNRVQRAVDLEIRRMAHSMWLNPKGSGLSVFGGEAGWVANYNPLTLGGTTVAKPERLTPQLQYLQYMIEIIKQIDDEIERVVGNFDVGGGNTPAGVVAASALSLLDQNRKKALGPMVYERAKMYLALDEMTLELARKHWTDKRIRVAAGNNKVWEVDTFMNADLQGAVNMEIDFESLFPASEATERAEIEQLIQGGVISGQDPEQRYEILKKFGKLGMLGSADEHTKVAQKENDAFMKSGGTTLPKIMPTVDNSMIHIREHVLLCCTDEFRTLPDPVQQGMLEHIAAHYVEEGEKRALLAQMQLNPDSPAAVNITAADAQAAAQGAGQVGGGGVPNPGGVPGSNAGSSVGSRAPKGTTGAGPNQAKAQEARTQQVMTQPVPQPADIAASPGASAITGA